jgi:hypothetical protein
LHCSAPSSLHLSFPSSPHLNFKAPLSLCIPASSPVHPQLFLTSSPFLCILNSLLIAFSLLASILKLPCSSPQIHPCPSLGNLTSRPLHPHSHLHPQPSVPLTQQHQSPILHLHFSLAPISACVFPSHS